MVLSVSNVNIFAGFLHQACPLPTDRPLPLLLRLHSYVRSYLSIQLSISSSGGGRRLRDQLGKVGDLSTLEVKRPLGVGAVDAEAAGVVGGLGGGRRGYGVRQ